jgi:hypothetical protein
MRKQVEAWQRCELTDVTAKVVIFEAFVEGKLEAPKHLARTVHDLYFEPKYDEFKSRTIWKLSNAFTSAFKALEPIPQFKATAKLSEFLETRFSISLWLRLGRRALGLNRASRDFQRARRRWPPGSSMGSECSPQFARFLRRSPSYE